MSLFPEPVASDVLSKRDTDNERAGAGLLVSYAGGPIGTSRLAPAPIFSCGYRTWRTM
nr:hypothetical protein [Candidatus Sigynarchaeota archaeon]